MKYEELVNVYEALGATTKRLEKTEILADFLKTVELEDLQKITLMALGRVFPPWSEEEQGIGDKLVMKAVGDAVGVSVAVVEDAIRDEGDIGAAAEKLYGKKTQMTFFSQPLTVNFVYNQLRKLAKITGNRSTAKKISNILELLSSASALEAKYICRTILEELRIGVGEGIIRDAISQAFGVDKALAERAHMLTNDLGLVAKVAKEEGEDGLKKLSLIPGRPVKPMLAQLSEGIEISINEMGCALCETKYDGIRMQVHKKDDEITIFTRRLENVTMALPEAVDLIREAFPDEDFIAEGEIIAIRDGKPTTFQNILQRVRRKHNIEEAMEKVPIKIYLYDLLYFKEPTIDEPIIKRREILESVVDCSNPNLALSSLVKVGPDNIDDAVDLFNKSIEGGHEGIMIKDCDEPYIPGIRGKKMLKLKAEPETLDAVVIGGVKGIGKRGDFIGSYVIALRDENDQLQPIAHVGTGLSDDDLANLTEKMEALKITEKGTRITVHPKIVFEIAYSEIVKSPEYSAGYSLRFPVVKRIRDDKGVDDIDTIERLESMFKG
ncbi:ATP-dependent DNA ligase DnlI [Methanobrevibacter ruminantium M1]|uniref:DNA ligase n=1 Tax=Methanobrevibacter ruminantium (strain ATCC 35063 / DSM 1093 / JCM 13430 / OCM 146 / M1) TaxID=634498 RepID=D3E0Q0_METRM|nr:ATP-dependent DNA ligase [Methanobrevibacter ruminantium]ADC46296.1 ATP-dependent DNA ligase DnlI [Methanobrevibacter ruminantium M1]